MSPTQVQWLYFFSPIVNSFICIFLQKLSTKIGRIQTILICVIWASTQLLIFYHYIEVLESHIYWVMVLQVIRSAVANGYFPLEESVLMDAVPRNKRGLWKSLDSVSSFGWSGSAFLGGMISKKNDYSSTFYATALLTLCGVPILLYLAKIVPKYEKIEKLETEDEVVKEEIKVDSLKASLLSQDSLHSKDSYFSG
jgi:MFS family permease